MPKLIIFEFNKSILDAQPEILELDQVQNNKKIKLNIPCEISFEKDEYESITEYINNNKNFETIKIQFPGNLDLKTILTGDIIKEQISNLKITVKENETTSSSSTMEYM